MTKLNKEKVREMVDYLKEYSESTKTKSMISSGILNVDSSVFYCESDDSYYLNGQSIETKIDSEDWTH